MKALVWIAVLGGLGGAAAYGHHVHEQSGRQSAYSLALADLKRDFLANTSSLYALDDAAYRKDVGVHLGKYFTAVQDLGNGTLRRETVGLPPQAGLDLLRSSCGTGTPPAGRTPA